MPRPDPRLKPLADKLDELAVHMKTIWSRPKRIAVTASLGAQESIQAPTGKPVGITQHAFFLLKTIANLFQGR